MTVISKGLTAWKDEEDGAVTVDWVVLTAALIGLSILVFTPIAYSSNSMANQTGNMVSTVPVGYSGG